MARTNDAPEGFSGKLVLIAGSAGPDADEYKLARAHEFVRLLARGVLGADGGLVVFASSEPINTAGTPLVFDWTIVREVERSASDANTSPRLVIVTSEKARSKKMNDEQRGLLARLCAHGIADVVSLPNDVHTGGNIGDEQTSRAVAMFAIGGGKGVVDRAWKLRKVGRPVLPFDLAIGALSNDGDGAVGLNRSLMEDPTRFFPRTGNLLLPRMLGMSLDAPVVELGELAQRSIRAVLAELEAERQASPLEVLVLTALPVELAASRQALGTTNTAPTVARNGTNYWRAVLQEQNGLERRVGLACFGAAGNVDAAATTATLISDLRPKAVVMVGIAAGMREKCSLGEVVIADRIVAYEGAALVSGSGGSQSVSRHEMYRTAHAVQQDIVAYLSSEDVLRSRLRTAYETAGLELPRQADAGPVASDVVPRQATLASGEKLLRDPTKFRTLREVHGKIEVAEMEAAGIAAACSQAGVLLLVVRGISDFGDEKKDDRFHRIAAKAAAVVAVDFLRHGLRSLA